MSDRFHFENVDIQNLEDLDLAIERGDFLAVIVNYHPQTLPYISVAMPRRYRTACIAVMHEMTQAEADSMPRGFFQYYVMGDPSLRANNLYVFATGRIIPPYENRKPLPKIPTIGSFGFSVGSKGFQRLVDVVQEEFDEAVIRINIAANGIIDRDGALAGQQVELCRSRLWKPGIRLEATHVFFDNASLIDFLASNTLNAFLYDYLPKAGIASAADHGMTARRPIAVTKSIMFRHLHDLMPPVTIENVSLKEIIRNGTRPYDHLLREWAPERICLQYENILSNVLSANAPPVQAEPTATSQTPSEEVLNKRRKMTTLFLRVIRAIQWRTTKYVLRPSIFLLKTARLKLLAWSRSSNAKSRFNRILDDDARIEHARTIRRLAELVPDVVAKKIPRANIQQAFVFDTVEILTRNFANPRILCIGSFEDSAAIGLKKVGFPIEEIDPVVNQLDLNGFYHLPTTRRGSYDVIFSTSVLEHVKDDERFVEQMADLLAPGGIGVLTCDFKEGYKVGDPVIAGDYRFYTKQDLLERITKAAKDCEYVDIPEWDCTSPDFELGGFKYTFATLVFRKRAKQDLPVAWDRLSSSEQTSYFNENGFLVVPAVLSGEEVRQAIEEIGKIGLRGTTEDVWNAPFARRLVANPKLLATLTAIFGQDIRFFKAAYVETSPSGKGAISQQRKALHVDYGIGEPEGDLRNSAASWVNVAYYLTDLTPEHSPLWVVPGSNRSYGVVPASNFEHLEDRARMVLARAGDAVLFHANTVHAASHNFSSETRHALFYSYRPAWAKPVGPVPEWPEQFIQSFPVEYQYLLKNLNGGL
jgi:SAM-dependent methyltransferase